MGCVQNGRCARPGSRAFAGALIVAIAALLDARGLATELDAGSGSSDGAEGTTRLAAAPQDLLSTALAAPESLSHLFCLWERVQYGRVRYESAAWVLRDPGRPLLFLPWPLTGFDLLQVWHGAQPAGALAIVHTHPDTADASPSDADMQLARRRSLFVVTVARSGIWAGAPDGSVRKLAGDDWYREAARTCSCGSSLACQGPAAVRAVAADIPAHVAR